VGIRRDRVDERPATLRDLHHGAYVTGTLAAFIYKMAVGSVKHIAEKTFSLKALLLPILWSAILTFPLVFLIAPRYGKPTGVFFTDMIYAYLTCYATIDMLADYYTINHIIRGKYLTAPSKVPYAPDE